MIDGDSLPPSYAAREDKDGPPSSCSQSQKSINILSHCFSTPASTNSHGGTHAIRCRSHAFMLRLERDGVGTWVPFASPCPD